MSPRPRPSARLLLVPVLAFVLALVLAACSRGTDDSAQSADSGGGDAPAAAEAGSVDEQDLDGLRGADAVGAARAAGRTAPLAREVIRTGEATLQADDVLGLRDEVGGLVDRFGGYVSSERSFNDDKGRLVEDRLVLRIPSQRFDDLMTAFAQVATVLQPSTKTQDVTTEVIDVDSRIRTAEVSLDRLRSFLQRSNDVNALIRLESEMADREADLASLRAQQDYLEDQTSLATVTVTLQRTPEDEPGDGPGDGGFLAGLAGGWDALRGALVVAATMLGALLPFALVIALLGIPVLLVARAARRRRPVVPAAAPVSQGMSAD